MGKEKSITDYLERFGTKCFLCGVECGTDGRLVQSIVGLCIEGKSNNSHITQYYIACPVCREGKVLV
jgi:hypothetical protein